MKPLERLLLENKAWAQEKAAHDPDFFENLRQPRHPDVFWIGCSDSRVHADQVTQSEPGEIFVHRNIGNQVVVMDMNFLAALEYAVDFLKVKHIVVCGHYGCGSIQAAMGKPQPDHLFMNKWLKYIKDIHRLHRATIDAEPSEEARHNRLVELNVIEQVHNLAQTSVIQRAWRSGNRPDLHGWVYGLNDGIIKEIASLEPDNPCDPTCEQEPGVDTVRDS
ncbi:carbonic anhydrase [Methylocaldum szegediense]|uniref:Carbonic anhydrase n=1 Tax=Methylocaldum szegediense TaxID=73780 RepID=A0ABM9HX36_9GAMM|nr:carbonic anhydrase [Methylocaldum szegediense]CAI8743852.1 Carbonic anhydrase 2 [Methylocaldum szegediense]